MGGRAGRRPGPASGSLDLCAAPGGKATALAGAGADVVAADVRPGRVGLVAGNVGPRRHRRPACRAVVADGRAGPLRARRRSTGCSSTPPARASASLRRRPDARWRIEPDAVDRLAALQRELLDAAVGRWSAPAGRSSTACAPSPPAETTGVDAVAGRRPVPTSSRCRRPASRGVPLGARRAPPAPGRRHRRHVPPPLPPSRLSRPSPTARSSGQSAGVTGRPCSTAKVLTVSDGVVAGTREDRSGAALVERLTEAGLRRRRPAWSWPTASSEVADALRRADRGLRRPGRHHRRHRLRPPRPHPRGHPRRARPRGARAWPRPCAWSTRSAACRGASPAPCGTALVLNTPGLHRRARSSASSRARRRPPRPRPPGRRPPALSSAAPADLAGDCVAISTVPVLHCWPTTDIAAPRGVGWKSRPAVRARDPLRPRSVGRPGGTPGPTVTVRMEARSASGCPRRR